VSFRDFRVIPWPCQITDREFVTVIPKVGVLGVWAVNAEPPFHRQDAKNAKNFARQNSLQKSKDLRLSMD
jgi:hypothetical protein